MRFNIFVSGIWLAGLLLASVVPAAASYAVPGIPGDYTDDGVVDAADYVVWRNAEGSNTILVNNPVSSLPVGDAHYNVWRGNFGRAAGAGAVTTLSQNASVPEPGTFAVAIVLAVGFWAVYCRSCRRV